MKTNKPSISVIVPVYNMEKYLHRCVDSILNQTFENIEILLIDDGSTDRSPQICDNYERTDCRVKSVHKKNGGLSSARNVGLELAVGEYIGFVDSDDFLAPNAYETLYGEIENCDDIISNSVAVRYTQEGSTYPYAAKHDIKVETQISDYVRELMLHTGDSSVCTKLFPREVIGDIRFENGKLNEDFLFMLAVSSNIKSIRYTGQSSYYYFVREGSISSRYGKAIEDMVSNSITAKMFMCVYYPQYLKETNRFVFYQHMGYLLLVPSELRKNSNKQYVEAKQYVRKNYLSDAVNNKYLKLKEKMILLALCIVPGYTAELYQRKRR